VSAFFNDANGNNFFDSGENFTVVGFGGFDINNPSLATTPNEIDPNLDPSLTDELLLGVDVTWRNSADLLTTRGFILDNGVKRLANRNDWVLERTTSSDGVNVPHLPDDTPWTANFHGLRPGLASAGGTLLTNGDSKREYLGASVTITKRLSNRWMARSYFQYGDTEYDFGSEDRFYDSPTGAPSGADGSVDSPDGDLFVVQSAGSGPFENVFIQSTWSANLNGLYQVAPGRPWGFNIAGNFFAREGYPLLYSWTEQALANGVGSVTATATDSVDQFRADAVYSLDLRLEKDMQFTDNLSGILSLDAFNVTNENHILGREVELETSQANFVTQTLSPRIYRLGFRLNWR